MRTRSRTTTTATASRRRFRRSDWHGDPRFRHWNSAAETGHASLRYSRSSFRLRRFLSRSPCLGLEPRLLIVVALPALAIGAISHRLSRPSAAGVALLLGVLALGAGLIARSNLLIVAGVLYLLAGISRGWGVNRGRRRRRAWTNRLLAVVGAVLVGFFVVFPTLLAVDFLAKPRASINQAALGIAARARRPSLPATAFTSSGWYVPSRNGAAIVLVHGGGGDRQGTILHARMLAKAGYGVLLYDARGPRRERRTRERSRLAMGPRRTRGRLLPDKPRHRPHRLAWTVHRRRSGRHRGCVRQARRSGRCGRPTGPHRRRRQPPSFGDRISIEPSFAVAGIEIRLARGETQPRPLIDVVHEVARTRPLLLIATIAFEREIDHVYTRGTKAQLWELPTSAHTKGLQDHPITYAQRVLSVFNQALLSSHRGK